MGPHFGAHTRKRPIKALVKEGVGIQSNLWGKLYSRGRMRKGSTLNKGHPMADTLGEVIRGVKEYPWFSVVPLLMLPLRINFTP